MKRLLHIPLSALQWVGVVALGGVVVGSLASAATFTFWSLTVAVAAPLVDQFVRLLTRGHGESDRISGMVLISFRPLFWGAAGFTLMFFLAARTTGAGWLIVLCCLIVGAVLIGAVAPPFTLSRQRVRMSAPTDAVAGEPFHPMFEVSRPGLGLAAKRMVPEAQLVAVLDGANPLGPMVSERGVIDEIPILIASSAPIGMCAWARTMTVPLDQPIYVAPRMGTAQETNESRDSVEGEMTGARPTHGDRLRSVREYTSGDAMRLVHWPASARRGGLVVKELESPANPHLHLVVTLHGVPELDERICENAMATAVQALEERRPVTLHTNDGSGPRVTPVRHRRDAGRALAAAAAGHVPEPDDVHGRVIRLTARSAA